MEGKGLQETSFFVLPFMLISDFRSQRENNTATRDRGVSLALFHGHAGYRELENFRVGDSLPDHEHFFSKGSQQPLRKKHIGA
jgi:hypothetical protein